MAPVTVIVTDKPNPVPIQMVEADKSLKTLGQLVNPSLYWADQLLEIKKKCEETALVLSANVDRTSAELYWTLCHERSIIYKALFMEVTEEQFYGATKSACGGYKHKMGLSRSTSSKACYAFGVGDTWMLLMIERLMVLQRRQREDKTGNGTFAHVSLLRLMCFFRCHCSLFMDKPNNRKGKPQLTIRKHQRITPPKTNA